MIFEQYTFENESTIPSELKERIQLDEDGSLINIEEAFFMGQVDKIAYRSVFGEPKEKLRLRKLIRVVAAYFKIYPASLHNLYEDFLQNEPSFCVPALNLRSVPFTASQAVFEAMNEKNIKTVIFELSRGETIFTNQSPGEYASVILAAAIKTKFQGPIFFQGDHFQLSKRRYDENPSQEIDSLKRLLKEAIEFGFYNIDLDCSTLVDLDQLTVYEQQRKNFENTKLLIDYCREIFPTSVIPTFGAEIGEIGENNTSIEEIDNFFKGLLNQKSHDFNIKKMAVQTGTKHGGNISKSGAILDMDVDYECIAILSNHLRESYNVPGIAQHGASTLSPDKLSQLKNSGCIEVHLAATFLNIVYDSLPENEISDAYRLIHEQYSHEKTKEMSNAQFLYHARRLVIGELKHTWWNLKNDFHEKVFEETKRKAIEIFECLGVVNTSEIIENLYSSNLYRSHDPLTSSDIENNIGYSDFNSSDFTE